jgi:hypothetical protein
MHFCYTCLPKKEGKKKERERVRINVLIWYFNKIINKTNIHLLHPEKCHLNKNNIWSHQNYVKRFYFLLSFLKATHRFIIAKMSIITHDLEWNHLWNNFRVFFNARNQPLRYIVKWVWKYINLLLTPLY